jgi:hypothetical protein
MGKRISATQTNLPIGEAARIRRKTCWFCFNPFLSVSIRGFIELIQAKA